MIKEITNVAKDFDDRMLKVRDLKDVENIQKDFFGKDAKLSQILKNINQLPPENRQKIGQIANNLRREMTEKINQKRNFFQEKNFAEGLKNDAFDVSLPGFNFEFGTQHPLNLVMEEIREIFTAIGFEMVEGTEIESDLYNFQKLNLPPNHPARDMQDTFYIDDQTLLRTHATNVTARSLTAAAHEQEGVEIDTAIISAGNVYRRDDDDATHSHQFMQIDGFAVGQHISFANLKWLLKYMCRRLFGSEVNIRLRPSYFPFTEPSVEVDISCFKCQTGGCELCKYSGWIEILGAGLINEQVLKLNGLDPHKISGLAFGVGIERIAMLKFGINNIRLFYENNLKFLNQFNFYGE